MEFKADKDIDRRTCHRTVPMKVLVLGLGRTGTNSIRQALGMLGYHETYHMTSTSGDNCRDSVMWLDALRAKYDGIGKFGRKDWDQLLGHCQAVTDFPAACFAPELIETYPEAKVILSNRDVDSWYNSILQTIDWRYHELGLFWLSYVDPQYRLYAPMFYKMWDFFFKGDFRRNGKEVFEAHYKEVRSLVPRENLLEFDIKKDGWEQLCSFLDVDIPDRQFPAGNKAGSFQGSCRGRNLAKAGQFAAKLGAVAVVAAALYLGVKRML